MNKIHLITLFLFFALIGIAGFYIFVYEYESAGDDDDDEQGGLVFQSGIVALSEQAQHVADIQTKQAQNAFYEPEYPAIAEVIAVHGLVDFYAGLNKLKNELALSENTLSASAKELHRVELLNQSGSAVSPRRYDEARRQYQEDLIRSANIKRKIVLLKQRLLREWGEEVAQWFFGENTPILQQILSGERQLLNVTLVSSEAVKTDKKLAYIAKTTDRKTAIEATYVSFSKQAGSSAKLNTYLFSVVNENVRVGLKLHAWVPGGVQLQGVQIDADAVVWYENKPWIYIKEASTRFRRHVLKAYYPQRAAWFVADKQLDDVEYVAVGAQTVLSEEFRWFIPDEDDAT